MNLCCVGDTARSTSFIDIFLDAFIEFNSSGFAPVNIIETHPWQANESICGAIDWSAEYTVDGVWVFRTNKIAIISTYSHSQRPWRRSYVALSTLSPGTVRKMLLLIQRPL